MGSRLGINNGEKKKNIATQGNPKGNGEIKEILTRGSGCYISTDRSYGIPLAAWKRAILMSASFCRSSSLMIPLPSVSTKVIKRLMACSASAIVGGAETPGPRRVCP